MHPGFAITLPARGDALLPQQAQMQERLVSGLNRPRWVATVAFKMSMARRLVRR